MTKKIQAYITVQVLQQIADTLANSILTVYLLKKNFSYTQIGIMWIFFLAISMICEYPSGGLADRFGRRKIYSLGVILTIFSYIFILNNSFPLLCISYSIKGVASALISGTLNAWLSHESVDNENFRHILSKSKIIETIGIVIITASLTVFNVHNLSVYIYIVIAIEIVIIFISTFFMPDNYGSNENILKINRMAFSELIHSKELRYAVLISCIIYMYFTTFNFVWQPIANACSIKIKYFALLNALSTLTAGLSSYVYGRKLKISQSVAIVIFTITYSISLVFFLFSNLTYNPILLITSMIFFGVGKGISFILLSTWVNQYSSTNYKASIFSLIAAISSITNLILQYVFGYVADIFGLSYILIINLVLSLIIACIYFIIRLISTQK